MVAERTRHFFDEEAARIVRTGVMVGGVWRVANGEIVALDLEALMARHREAARSLVLAA